MDFVLLTGNFNMLAAKTLAFDQALWGALSAGREKEGEMLIGGDDNDVITLGTCFSMLVCIRARFRFALIGGNQTAQSTGSHRGSGGGI